MQDWKLNNSCIKVDFKEFQKSKNSQLIYTEGVATCTAMTINRYDILPCEKSLLQIGVVATHDSSFKNIIHKLIGNEVELSQIKVLIKKNSKKVDVIFDYENDKVWTQCGERGFDLTYTDEYDYAPDFGEIIKKLSNYNRA